MIPGCQGTRGFDLAKAPRSSITILAAFVILLCTGLLLLAEETPADPSPPATLKSDRDAPEQWFNLHAQNTDIVQGYPAFPAEYSGPNSLPNGGEVRETISLDTYAGVRLWSGAEAHVDGLMWQGFGIGKTLGVEGFPNGEAFRLGTDIPNLNFSRVFIRQTFGLGGGREAVQDDALYLGGTRDASRITLTLGKLSAKDIFDNNAYANDPRTQFMNWGLMANETWDYPADSLGFMTGMALECYLPPWVLRYGFFQMPRVANGVALDSHWLEAWGMVAELERSYLMSGHPGTVRVLAFLNRAHMGSYEQAVNSDVRPADIEATREYRFKFGFGLNFEQEIAANVGVFSRLGWSDGETEAWTFADVDRTASVGISIKGVPWGRPDDTFGLAGVLNGISDIHRRFFEAGGKGILAGDGRLTYGLEQSLETYYDFQIYKGIHGTLDYQFVANPAFNRDRGPVNVLGARFHAQF